MGAATDTSPHTDNPTFGLNAANRTGDLLALAVASLAIVALVLYGLLALRNAVPGAVFMGAALGGLVALGLLVLRKASGQRVAQWVAVLCFVQAVFSAGLLFQVADPTLDTLWGVATVAVGICLAYLALVFPTPYVHPRLVAQPFLRYLPLLLVVTLIFWPVAAVIIGLLVLGVRLYLTRRHTETVLARDHAGIVLVGVGIALLALVLWTVRLLPDLRLTTPFLTMPALCLAFVLLQPNRLTGDRAIATVTTYGLMLALVVVGYVLLVFGVSLLAGQVVNANDTGLLALLVFGVALLFSPLRTGLQTRVESYFLRERQRRTADAETYAQQLGLLSRADDILTAFRSRLQTSFAPVYLAVFLPDNATDAYAAPGAETDLRFSPNSPLIDYLRHEPVLSLVSGQAWPADVVAERARLRVLDAQLVLALPGTDHLLGFVVLGAASDGTRYTFEAIQHMKELARQTAVAYERALVVDGLERRVRELGILSQVSQAVNFTLNSDDLLELIATQIERLVTATHLYIVLQDDLSGDWSFAFFLEKDERYTDRENQHHPLGRDLFSEVLRSGQPLRVADYERALAERHLSPGVEDAHMKAWMAVPLVAGQRALGLLAVGNDKLGQPYTDSQLNSLTEISSLVATSLDKARLFEETNARARQLAALNEVSGQLVAVESDLRALLTFVTDTAGSILRADAASLMMVTDDGLRYEVARGMGREALTGAVANMNDLAQRVVKTGMQQRESNPDHALAVPLVAQSGVIGVLEVVNAASRRPFSREDSELLATFAGQAAIAIENARLFQMTDFQLSQRVAELETMERVDVELNRSLDIARVAEITVQAAVEYSAAQAGLLGLIVPEQAHLQVVAATGYLAGEVEAEVAPGTWPASEGVVQRVIRTRRADLVLDTAYETGTRAGMGKTISQIAVPMLSGGEVSAVLLLETDREPRFNLAHLAYIQRLAEHASIAIANAQLYRELERANQSKSEFVSFVAHELKNPLTSIKGYSDILSKGVAGSLTDQQRMFISTIHGNADRMTTLVSDLNDVTKLQTDNMRIDLADVSFAEIATETLRPLQPQIESRQQTLELAMSDDLPRIRADKTRMIQVLTNLVSNAHKYTPDGGRITLAAVVEAAMQDSKGRALGPMLHVQVQDTGIGMSEADLRKLFTAYFRSDNPLARQQPGTGLGLTITQGLVLRHGGDIWADSVIGQGTTFHFTVPLASEPAT